MADIGNTTIGGFMVGTDTDGEVLANLYTAGATFTPTHIYVYFDEAWGVAGDLYVAVYSDNAGTPNSVLFSGNAGYDSGHNGWLEIPVSGVELTNGNDYWIAVYGYKDSGTHNLDFKAISAAQNVQTWNEGSEGSWTATPSDSQHSAGREVTMYATDVQQGGPSVNVSDNITITEDTPVQLSAPSNLDINIFETITITESSTADPSETIRSVNSSESITITEDVEVEVEFTPASAYSITIDGTDRTGDILSGSVVITDAINDKTNTCRFKLRDLSGSGIPSNDEEIIIIREAVKIFAGYVVNVSMDGSKRLGKVTSLVSCVDYTRLLDRNLVHKTYEDATDKEIIENIVSTYMPDFGITTNNVLEGVTIDQISFNYIQPSQAIRQICDLTGRNWYIDYDKDIHYFPLTQNEAPFDIDSDSKHEINLRVSKDASQIKNRIYVRGGTKLSEFTTYAEVGDGEKVKFSLPDKPHNVTVEVDTGGGYVEKTVGIKNVDISGYDWYLNFQEKYLEQDSGGSVLTSSHKLKITYKYDIPILVAVENSASIEESGQHEFAIFDKTITTTQAARDRASAELTDYANSIIEASFTTYIPGFISGQYININLTDYDINDDYIVQRVRITSIGAGNFVYTVSLASSKTMGIIRFLIELLEANKNLIELDDDEVVDELLEASDSLLSDSLLDSLVIDSAGPYRTWADTPTDASATRARWNLFSWK